MTHIAIFCDGTWNSPERTFPTNVQLLCDYLKAQDSADVHLIYSRGVGARPMPDWVSCTVDRLGGGAFGWGLGDILESVYRELAKVYEPGDEIHIFGFSRGAFMARSLAGLIRASGIPAEDQFCRIDEAVARYRDRAPLTEPGTAASAAFRWRFSPRVYTGQSEHDWRVARSLPVGTPLSISYLGIWDTVGALGVPGIGGALGKLVNSRYQFHDTVLSRSVRAGRHAVAIDEARVFFKPTLWKNLDKLNASGARGAYLQEWFPGDHSMVGGGGDDRGITDQALRWIAEGAVATGLPIDLGALPAVTEESARGPLTNSTGRGLLGVLRSARDGPGDTEDLADPTWTRLRLGALDGTAYRPAPLSLLWQAISNALGWPYAEPWYPVATPPEPHLPVPRPPVQRPPVPRPPKSTAPRPRPRPEA